MEPVSVLIKSSIPNYLSNLPIPNSIGGWFKLGIRDWATLVPFFAAVGGISYVTYKAVSPIRPINPWIKKDEKKVVDIANIEDLGDKTSYCRCWRSKKFPLCDGAHGLHNKLTGDNVGPVVIKRASPEK